MINDIPKPEWIKLIPADSIPVFCFAPDTLDRDLAHYAEELFEFFGSRKVLVIRGNVDIYAIADPASVGTEDVPFVMKPMVPKGNITIQPMGTFVPDAATQQPQCICGGEPHVSHCPANRDPFLRGLL